jgi:peptidoglycan hydrolase CwlO-like protein
MQMKGAFNVLKRSYPTFTKEIILSSIDTYIGIVNEEKEKGLKESEQIRKEKIDQKVSSINNMKNSAAEILSQIDELKKKYDEMNNDIAVLEREVTQAQNELQAQENVFNNSVQSVINTLNTDKAKVTNLDI